MTSEPMRAVITDSHGLARNTEQAMVVLQISRDRVEKGNIADALDCLMVLTDTKENFRLYKESLVVTVDGYGNDSRELHEIPEVGAFFEKLSAEWPYWVWFLQRGCGGVALILSLMCTTEVERDKDGNASGCCFKNRDEIIDRLSDWSERSSQTFAMYGISVEEAKASAMSAMEDFL